MFWKGPTEKKLETKSWWGQVWLDEHRSRIVYAGNRVWLPVTGNYRNYEDTWTLQTQNIWLVVPKGIKELQVCSAQNIQVLPKREWKVLPGTSLESGPSYVEAEFADTESWRTNLSEIISSGTFLPPNICTFILSSCFLTTVLWMEIKSFGSMFVHQPDWPQPGILHSLDHPISLVFIPQSALIWAVSCSQVNPSDYRQTMPKTLNYDLGVIHQLIFINIERKGHS